MSANYENLLHSLAPQVLSALTRRFGDFSSAEDAVQEALIAASKQWTQDNLPDNPRAWLTRVAFRRMVDQIRADEARKRRETLATVALPIDQQVAMTVDQIDNEEDDTLSLLFLCCHPSLTSTSAITLTLRAVGGLTTAEIARAFLVPEATMGQRISRAKQTIQTAGATFSTPEPSELPQRLVPVLHVLYLIFNEGYTSSSGLELIRTDLASEAIRLAREVNRLVPSNGEVMGLLALMLLTDARRPARTTATGNLIPLAEQDRSLWNREMIAEGVELVSTALGQGVIGQYQLQAAIAAAHDEAPSAAETDWQDILGLYTVLARLIDNPMILLNRAIAVAMVSGPEAGLKLLDELETDSRLQDHHRLHATRAHFLEMTGDIQTAIRHYRNAAARTTSIPEHHYLTTKAALLAKNSSPND